MMQKIIVKNCETAAGSVRGSGDNEFTVKPIIDDIAKCSAEFQPTYARDRGKLPLQ